MNQNLQNKKGLVQSVFNKVYDKYDLMNDFMSMGIHRLWKKDMINWMAPFPKKKLIDMACGTGDLGKLFLENTNYQGKVLFVDPNSKMIKKGIERLKKHKNLPPGFKTLCASFKDLLIFFVFLRPKLIQ